MFVSTRDFEETITESTKLLNELRNPKVLIQTVLAGSFWLFLYISLILLGE